MSDLSLEISLSADSDRRRALRAHFLVPASIFIDRSPTATEDVS